MRPNTLNILYFNAHKGRVGMRNISDYSPFGVLLIERATESSFYRKGFQGQEHDDEVKGEGNSVNFAYRMHDPRVGRFFAVDPLARQYPHYSPYSFSGNKVIAYGELEGLEEIQKFIPTKNSSSEVQVANTAEINNQLCFVNPNHTYKPLPPEFLETIGTGLSFGGTIVSTTGYVCTFIPLPQTQAAAKYLIPIGESMEAIGTTLTVTDNLAEGDYDNALKDVIITTVSFGIGKSTDELYDASKISMDDVNGIKIATTIEEPLVGEWLSSDNNKASNSFQSGNAATNPKAPSSMYNYVQKFQETITTKPKTANKSNNAESTKKLVNNLVSGKPLWRQNVNQPKNK
jgi:RHS repeat-associated protein